jgi:CRP-like cAMP-binding protein
LDEAQLATLAEIAQPVQFREQELILAAREPSLDFYLVLSGSVSIELNNRHYAVRIQSLGPGDAFGWSALLEHHDTLFDVRTRERCTALRLDGARLSAALRKDPVFGAELLRRTLHLVAGRVHATEMRLGEFCGVRMRTTEQKVADATILP